MSNVLEMVLDYFKTNELKYEPICVRPCNVCKADDYFYCVLAKYIGDADFKKNTYAVWTCFNTSTNSMNCGYYDMSYEEARKFFIDYGKEKQPIPYGRLSELATLFKDKLMEDDNEYAIDYFLDDCEMSDEEFDCFGLDKPKRFKEVTLKLEVPVVAPEDDKDFNYGELLHSAVDNKSFDYTIEDEEYEVNLEDYQNYYGYSQCKG